MPDGLKISNRTGQQCYDSAWIAGVHYENEAFEDAQDKDYEDQQASDNESNDDILGEDYNEMTPDEIYETEQLELNHIQEDDPEHEGNKENNVEMNADEIQDEDEEPVNENEEAMLEVNPSTEDDTDPNVRTARSGRVSRPPSKLTIVQHQLHTRAHCQEEYTTDNAKVITMTMCYLNEMSIDIEAFHFVQSYSLKRGLQKFGQKGRDAAYKEMEQLHDRVVFEPIRIEDLTEIEKRRAMESLIFWLKRETRVLKAVLVPMAVRNVNTWKEMKQLVRLP
jgi:hypothetical protein